MRKRIEREFSILAKRAVLCLECQCRILTIIRFECDWRQAGPAGLSPPARPSRPPIAVDRHLPRDRLLKIPSPAPLHLPHTAGGGPLGPPAPPPRAVPFT